MSTELFTAALRVRDLQEQADRAEVRGLVKDYLACLRDLAKARSELERLNDEAIRNGGAR